MTVSSSRTIEVEAVARVGVNVSNRASHFAAHWLTLLTGTNVANNPDAEIVVRGAANTDIQDGRPLAINLWDYQVGHAGCGGLASAISGAATVIGKAGGAPVPLPVEMPEKWCGLHGAILALAECWREPNATPRTSYDVSSADVLRSFALQNSGGPAEMAHSWRRNGRLCIDHGGIFPMGFFACRDGYVAILGRSRRDWKNIQAAIGNPAWAAQPEYENPFLVARDSVNANVLLEKTLARFSRDELLAGALAHEAVIAPVYTQKEAKAQSVFRPEFLSGDHPAMPFIGQLNAQADTRSPEQPAARLPGCLTAHSPTAGQPLAGLRVIELAWVWSGPMVGQLLAELGAEVIKIESPSRFDLYRTRGLEAMRGKMDEATRIESSLYFHSLNRNKTSLSIDLKTDAGRQTLVELAAASHLVIENFTVGTLDRLGLGAEVLAKANRSLVQLSMSGAGRGSSVEQIRSYGLILSALAGAESHITTDGEFVGSPTFSISDPNAALFATLAAIAAVLRARETGEGMALDLSQIEAAATLAGTPSITNDRYEVRQGDDGRDVIQVLDSGLSAVCCNLKILTLHHNFPTAPAGWRPTIPSPVSSNWLRHPGGSTACAHRCARTHRHWVVAMNMFSVASSTGQKTRSKRWRRDDKHRDHGQDTPCHHIA